jgi:hypothetical protein
MRKDLLAPTPGYLGLVTILVIAAILRLAWVLVVPIDPISDPAAYTTFARNLLAHGVYGFEPDQPIAIWPPGTAAVYAAVFALPGADFAAAKAFNVAVSLLNVMLVWQVGRQLFDDLSGRVAALVMAVWPQMIYFTTLIASEPIFIAVLLIAVLCWDRARQMGLGWLVAAGILFGLACYVRSVALLLPIALTLGTLVAGGMGPARALLRLAVTLAMMAAVISPWTIRNHQVFGTTVVMSSNFGSTFYMGNGPGTTGRHASAQVPAEVEERLEGLSQPERSSVLADLAKEEIVAHPGAFILRSLNKLRIIHDRETIGVACQMDLIAELEAEQIASLGKDIPDFKAGDTIRVGYKVTEGTRTRVQNYEGVCIAARMATASPDRSRCARSPSAKAWNVCSRCIRPISSRSRWCAAAASAARSCTTCARAAANRPGSPRTPPTSPNRARKRKEPDDEKRHPSRLPRDRREDDQWRCHPDALDLGRRRRPAVARHRPHRAPGLDRRHLAPDGHRRPRVEVQEEIRGPRLLSQS